MNQQYLFELERNLELQASGFLLQKQAHQLKSQIRTESFQINILDRLRININKVVEMKLISNEIISGKLIEVASDHLCLENNLKEIVIPLVSVLQFNYLSTETKPATMIQAKWNLQSCLRSLMIEKQLVVLKTLNQSCISGKVNGVFKDHFDFMVLKQRITFRFESIFYLTRDADLV
jgi:hypothetical protein